MQFESGLELDRMYQLCPDHGDSDGTYTTYGTCMFLTNMAMSLLPSASRSSRMSIGIKKIHHDPIMWIRGFKFLLAQAIVYNDMNMDTGFPCWLSHISLIS
jgi:hypothetical protein